MRIILETVFIRAEVVRLDIKPEMHHVAFLQDVFLAFEPPATCIFCALLTIACDKIVEAYDFGSDEAFFEIGMDYSGCFWGRIADPDSPGTDFLHAGSEVGL